MKALGALVMVVLGDLGALQVVIAPGSQVFAAAACGGLIGIGLVQLATSVFSSDRPF